MTGKGTSAIGTIGVFGSSALSVFTHIFQPLGASMPVLTPGRTCLGNIICAGAAIDQVILACERPQVYMIHCHGNPLIIKTIMELLEQHQVQLVSPEQMHCRTWRSQGLHTLAVEARLALLRARTLEGTRIIMRQIDGGLAETLSAWQAGIDSLSINAIQAQARSILERSEIGRRIIYGCRAVLVGPPNTGKSTLLNCLTGQDSAIVADVEGTTRDWIEVSCRMDSLYLTLVDTAGLDEDLMVQSDVDRIAQERSLDVLAQAELVLVVLDACGPVRQIPLGQRLQGKCVITVLNKSDLLKADVTVDRPQGLGPVLAVSAKQGTGISSLRTCIGQTLGIVDFDPGMPVCFTERQRRLLAGTQACSNRKQILHIIDTLLNAVLEDLESAHESR